MKRSLNLCSVYLLPLVGMNRFSFGKETNFINSSLSSDNKHLLVEVGKIEGFTPEANPLFLFDFSMPERNVEMVVYRFPERYLSDAELFRKGKYSYFSDEAKKMIRLKSGLRWKVPAANKTVISAFELLALDRDPDLKAHLENELQVQLPDDAELMSIPDETNFCSLQIKNVQQGQ